MSANARPLPTVPGFQLVRQVGRGGMGEVFHAVRVGPGGFRKTVALKQLVAEQHLSGRARQRFLEEAQVSAQLDHPNLVRVHDVVVAGGVNFIVMELLRGVNLVDAADALRATGPIAWPFAFEIAAQVLDGLAYAHDALDETGKRLALVHRDLTPRNMMLCTGGVVKILDFGIAKRADGPSLTHSGSIHGTIELLSPEQARGERADRRSDLYQLGATLYWLLANRFPHGDGTPGEIIARAAAGKPTSLRELVEGVPGAVHDVIEHAMAASPDDRYADAAAMRTAVTAVLATAPPHPAFADVIAALPIPDADVAASGHTISVTGEHTAAVEPAASEPAGPRRRWISIAMLAALAVLGAGIVVGKLTPSRSVGVPAKPAPVEPPHWKQLTFDAGALTEARFIPARTSYVYSGRWETKRSSVREASSTESRERLVVDDALLTAASRDNLLVILQPRSDGTRELGTLAMLPLAGGGPRELATDVGEAAIAPDGTTIAAIRRVKGKEWLEWPLGHKLVDVDGHVWSMRFSPSGQQLVAVENGSRGKRVFLLDRTGKRTDVGEPWGELFAVVWSPDASELWVSATRTRGKTLDLIATTIAGKERLLASAPDGLILTDVDRDGHALVLSERIEDRVTGDETGEGREHYLPTLYGRQPILSPDAKYYLFGDSEHPMPSGDMAIFKAPVDGSTAPVHFADGLPSYVLPDGSALLMTRGTRDRLTLVPLGAGEHVEIPIGDLQGIEAAMVLRDGRTALATASRGSEPPRLYAIDVNGVTPPRPLGPTGLKQPYQIQVTDPQSPDGTWIVMRDPTTMQFHVLRIADGHTEPVPGTDFLDNIMAWRADSRALISGTLALELVEIELGTGKRRLLRKFTPIDDTGDAHAGLVWMSKDLKRYIKWETQRHSFLFAVEGLR